MNEGMSPEEKLLKAVEKGRRARQEMKFPVWQTDWRGIGDKILKAVRFAADKSLAAILTAVEFSKALPAKVLQVRGSKISWARLSPAALLSGRKMDLRTVNHLLTGTVVCVLVFGLIHLAFFGPKDDILAGATVPGAAKSWDAPAPEVGSADSMLRLAQTRNLFSPVPIVVPTEQSGVTNPGAASAAPPGNGMKLVAVAISHGAFEAILENEAAGQSFFVRKGDKIEDTEVVAIDWDKVTLKKGNQQWDLE